MTISVKHAFTSPKADGTDSTLVQPSNWNADHNLTMASGNLLGRTTAGTGAVEEISVGTGLSLSSGVLDTAGVLSIAKGGTNASDAATARTNLGVVNANDATMTIAAGGGLSGGGAFTGNQSANSTVTVSHGATSTQASVTNTGTTVIQSVGVDGYGHVTSLASTTLNTTPTTAQVEAATAGANAGDVGTYSFLIHHGLVSGVTIFNPGQTITANGSNLQYTNVGTDISAVPSGTTWRCMAYTKYDSGTTSYPATLWLRIS